MFRRVAPRRHLRRHRPRPRATSIARGGSIYITPKVTTQLNGAGSSFAAPAIEAFTTAVKQAPYSLSVNYTSTSSGDGRYEFANNTTNFAVSDIAYGLGSTDTSPPTSPFIYVPVTAGGIAFMYNIPGPVQDAAAVELHGMRPADRRHHQLERPEAGGRQSRCRPAQSDRAARHRERLGRHQLRSRGVVHQPAARPVGSLRQSAEPPVGRPRRRCRDQRHPARVQLARAARRSRPAEHERGGREHRHQRRRHRCRPGEVRQRPRFRPHHARRRASPR